MIDPTIVQYRAGLSQSLNDLEAQLAQTKAAIPNLKKADQITAANQIVALIAERISTISKQLADLDAAHPLLTPPLGQENVTALKVGGNPWMKPSSLIAFISAMMYILRQEALYAAMEGQNVAKGMGMQEQLGQMEANFQKEQGDLELKKGITQGILEGVSGAMQFGGVAYRTSKTAGYMKSKQEKDLDAKTSQHIEKNQAKIAKKTMRNEATQRRIDNKGPQGEDAIGHDPNVKPAAPPVSPARKKELEAKMAERKAEIKNLEKSNAEVKSQADHQKSEMSRQDLVTQEQTMRGVEHFLSAGQKVVEGYYNQQIKYVEAEITMTRTHMDILKTFVQSATKGESEGREQAKAAADAMNQAYSQHTQSFWRGAS